LADDLQIPRVTVQQWWTRDSIPAEWFRPVVNAAKARGFKSVTESALMDALYARAARPENDDGVDLENKASA
jgi:hypothetical protein